MVTEFRFSLPCRSGGGLGWGPVAEERREIQLLVILRDADIPCILHLHYTTRHPIVTRSAPPYICSGASSSGKRPRRAWREALQRWQASAYNSSCASS